MSQIIPWTSKSKCTNGKRSSQHCFWAFNMFQAYNTKQHEPNKTTVPVLYLGFNMFQQFHVGARSMVLDDLTGVWVPLYGLSGNFPPKVSKFDLRNDTFHEILSGFLVHVFVAWLFCWCFLRYLFVAWPFLWFCRLMFWIFCLDFSYGKCLKSKAFLLEQPVTMTFCCEGSGWIETWPRFRDPNDEKKCQSNCIIWVRYGQMFQECLVWHRSLCKDVQSVKINVWLEIKLQVVAGSDVPSA